MCIKPPFKMALRNSNSHFQSFSQKEITANASKNTTIIMFTLILLLAIKYDYPNNMAKYGRYTILQLN